MANQELFNHRAPLPQMDALNEAGGAAYQRSAEQALAQYAMTGCFNETFYASAQMQLDAVLTLCDAVDARFVADVALYAREHGAMKDMPALLVAYLSVRDAALCEEVFARVIDDGKMLRNFVQILRSGVVARRSLGSFCKRLVQSWFESRSDEAVFRACVGEKPSLGDVIKLAHPRPQTASRAALYAYLLDRPYEDEQLPELVRAFEAWKRTKLGAPPAVPFQLLTQLELDRNAWTSIALNATWQQTRMNLATFARHDVFERGFTKHFRKNPVTTTIANKLRNPVEVRRARVMPYQLMMAHSASDGLVPSVVTDALEDAMEVALENVPSIDGGVVVCCDVSGSMSTPVTGHRKGATTKVRCIDVAALVAAAMLRKNDCMVLPFEDQVVELTLSKRDRVLTNAKKLASIGGGGTSCSAPLQRLNEWGADASLLVYVSDNESWCDPHFRGTKMLSEWHRYRERNPRAKLVCIDLQPSRTVQAKGPDVLDVGGFSDAVFDVIAAFAHGKLGSMSFVDVIRAARA